MDVPARLAHPGGTAHLHVTGDALTMVSTLGGHLHAFLGDGGCRSRSLLFTTAQPHRALEAALDVAPDADDVDWDDGEWTEQRLAALAERIPLADCRLTVSHELAPLLDGAVLDFGEHLGLERFVWARLPGDTTRGGRRCTCLRSLGEPLGRRGRCLDDARQGLVD